MSLKKLTDSIHKRAEQMPWAKHMLAGNMTNRQYGQYLYNQLQIYSALENRAAELRLFIDHPVLEKIRRVMQITHDLRHYKYHTGLESTTLRYIDYISTASLQDVLAHIYVRHFGDMHGGQIIKSKLPEPMQLEAFTDDSDNIIPTLEHMYTNLYIFEDKYELIKYVRSLLTLEMADEAILCFQFAIDLFSDLEKHFDL